MTEEHLADIRKAALRFVNDRRKEAGLRATSTLSKGRRVGWIDPISNSLEKVGVRYACADPAGGVWLAGYRPDTGRTLCWRWFDAPETAEFMRLFNDGKYPELEAKLKPIKPLVGVGA